MKRFLIVVMVLLGSALASRAQDMITLRSGESILAKVMEVSPSVVKYKRFNNLDGPTYTMNTALWMLWWPVSPAAAHECLLLHSPKRQ